jgi:short-subunit dehydrogenase
MNVWISGASAGIGRALALEYARRGWRVIASARRADRLKDLAEEMQSAAPGSPEMLPLPFDYRDAAGLQGAVDRAFDAIPADETLDLIILNAGISQRAWFRDTSAVLDEDILSVDLHAPIGLARHILSRLHAQGRGHLAAVGSLAGLIPAPMRSIYAAAKHGLHGFFKTLAVEEASRGIIVSLIIPGFVQSDISINALDSQGRRWNRMDREMAWGQTAEQAALRIRKGLERGKRVIYTGYDFSLKLARLLQRFAPGILHRILCNRAQKMEQEASE